MSLASTMPSSRWISADLRGNWNRLLDVAGLTPEERREAVRLFVVKVGLVPGTEV